MNKDYFDSAEFKDLLMAYEQSLDLGISTYLDIEDYVDISDYYLDNDETAMAMQAVDMGLRLHPGDELLLTVKAGVLVYDFKLEEAREIVESLDESKNADVVYLKGQLAYVLDNDLEKTNKLFHDWIVRSDEEFVADEYEDDKDEVLRDSYLHVLTSLTELCEEPDKDFLSSWVNEYIDKFSPLGNSAHDFELARICREEGLLDCIERVYTLLLETDPYLEDGWTVLASVQSVQGKYHEAINSAEFALAIDSNDMEALFAKGYSYFGLHEFQLALDDFLKYDKKMHDASLHLNIALCLISLDKRSASRRYVRSAAKHNEKTLKASWAEGEEGLRSYARRCFDIADAMLMAEIYAEAYDEIEKALDILPEEPGFLVLKGIVCIILEEEAEGKALFKKAIEFSDDKGGIIMLIGIRCMYEGYLEEALEFFMKVLSSYNDTPKSENAYAYVAYIYFRLSVVDSFLKYLKIASEKVPAMLSLLFKDIFPGNLNPEEYYDFVRSIIDFSAKNGNSWTYLDEIF